MINVDPPLDLVTYLNKFVKIYTRRITDNKTINEIIIDFKLRQKVLILYRHKIKNKRRNVSFDAFIQTEYLHIFVGGRRYDLIDSE